MPSLYDTRCDECSLVKEVRLPYSEVEKQLCECGGAIKIIITQANIASDAMPTRGWDNHPHAPKLLRPDGGPLNPGHTPPTTDMLRLNKDQVKRLGL